MFVCLSDVVTVSVNTSGTSNTDSLQIRTTRTDKTGNFRTDYINVKYTRKDLEKIQVNDDLGFKAL